MAQFYTKERSVTGASPQIYDDTQRILKEADDIIESMRAVSSIEEQQNATLINNLRAHRQREKELNTRNHQMLMDNMQQVAEAQQRKDKIALDNNNLKRKEDIAQEQRTMETLATLSKAAGQFAGAMTKEGIQQATDNALLKAQEIQAHAPQLKDAEGLALTGQLALAKQKEIADQSVGTVMKAAGKDLNLVANAFITQGTLERLSRQTLGTTKAKQLVNGGLENIILQNPDKIVTITKDGQEVQVPLKEVLTGNLTPGDLSRVYHELAREQLAGIKAGADPILFLKVDETINNFINTRYLDYTDKQVTDRIKYYNNLQQEDILSGDTVDQIARNASTYVDSAFTNPYLDRSTALNVVKNKVLPNVENPVEFAREFGKLQFRHMKDTDKRIGDTNTGTELLKEAQRLQAVKESEYQTKQKNIGKAKAIEFLKRSTSDGTTFSAAEYSQGPEYSQGLVDNRSMTFEAKLAFDNEIDSLYTQKRESKAVIAELNELANTADLSQTRIDDEYRVGNIDKDTADRLTKEVEPFANLKDSDGGAVNSASVKSSLGHVANTRVERDAVTGLAKSFTASLATDYILKKHYMGEMRRTAETIADPQIRHDQAVLTAIEAINSLPIIKDERGITHFRDFHPSFTTRKFPKAPPRTAEEVGHELRGDGVSRLDDPDYKVIDVNVPAYQRQIESDQPLKPTAYDQGVADAAGIPFHELLNRRFDALGIKGVKATEGSFGILRRDSYVSPELQRLLDGPKTFNKISSVIDRSPNLTPAQTGTGATAFHNVNSILKKLNTANSEALTAVWMLQTDEGRNQPNLTPLQQAIQLTEQYPGYAKSIIPYGQIASTDPKVAVALSKYADSHTTFAGGSKTIARLQTVALRQPLPQGPLKGITYADIRQAVFGASGEAVHGTKDVPLVIASILNRVADPRYPNTVQEVINQEGQYEAVYKGNSKFMPKLESYYSSVDGQQEIVEAFNLLQGRTDYKGQTQLKNRGEGDVMGDPTGNFFHYANQTGFGPYTGEVPTHYQKFIR